MTGFEKALVEEKISNWIFDLNLVYELLIDNDSINSEETVCATKSKRMETYLNTKQVSY